jgi:hypothetical protein
VKNVSGRAGSWSLRSLAVGKLYQAVKDEKTSLARSLRLLRSWLSPQQRVQFDTKGYFDVVGCDTGKRYRIRRGTSANVHCWVNVSDGPGRISFVFVPAGQAEAFFMDVTKGSAMAPTDPAFWRPFEMALVGPPLKLE